MLYRVTDQKPDRMEKVINFVLLYTTFQQDRRRLWYFVDDRVEVVADMC